MPYAGADPWPSDTLQLLGALLCVAAALLAFWPRTQRTSSAGTGDAVRGYPFLSLALLLILVAAPVVSLGGAQPVALGVVLTALTVAFLWLERLPLRPGLGIAAMLALAVAGALPLASAADGEDPWFDYKSFAEGFGPDEPLAFDWDHSYGPLTWPREGAEVLRVATTRPAYWKMRNLDDFDGEQWLDRGDRLGGSDPELALPDGWQAQAGWRETARVTLRRMQTREVLGTGTTLAVEDTSRHRRAGGRAGRLAIADRVPRRRLLHHPRLPAAPEPEAARRVGRRSRPAARRRPQPDRAGRGRRIRRARSAGDPGRDPLPAVPAARRRPDPVRGLSDARALPRRRQGAASLGLQRAPGGWPGSSSATPRRRTTTSSPPTASSRTASPTRRTRPRSRAAARRSTGSCSTPAAATASTSRARWRCCCGWAGSPRAS